MPVGQEGDVVETGRARSKQVPKCILCILYSPFLLFPLSFLHFNLRFRQNVIMQTQLASNSLCNPG